MTAKPKRVCHENSNGRERENQLSLNTHHPILAPASAFVSFLSDTPSSAQVYFSIARSRSSANRHRVVAVLLSSRSNALQRWIAPFVDHRFQSIPLVGWSEFDCHRSKPR